MTQTDDIRMVVTHDRQGTPADNTGLAKVAVQCSADTFVGNQSLVLRINICGEKRHLRQARKRYTPFCNLPFNPANVLQLKYIFGKFFELRDQLFCINGMTV